ncbi:MAG: radical SAM protein [Lachnospiraceae bacterium]|nr:radical SAM protein [Lachnospiraceae bacterium]
MEIYIHIPFCVKKCRYCDFYSVSCGKTTEFGCGEEKTHGSLPKTGDYVKALLKELDARIGEIKGKEVTSVFVGGGTPTILSCNELETLITGIGSRLNTGVRGRHEEDPDAEAGRSRARDESGKVKGLREEKGSGETEFTVECNPGTIDREKLTLMQQLGVNRLSIGLQSADNGELKALGRIHTYEEFLKNYEEARRAGFDNINVDLMSGIPGQTAASCEKTLNTVAGLGPEHISVYSLILEEGTPLYDDVEAGKVKLPGDDFDRDMYGLTGQILASYGYERYEISNYARPGRRCRHNMGYWTGEEYLGIGAAAASYLESAHPGSSSAGSYPEMGRAMLRYKNPNDLKAYLEDPAGVRVLEERLEREDLMSEFMILRLRLMRGASKEEFFKRFGVTIADIFGDVIKKQTKLGLIEDRDGFVSLTSRGLDLANSVMCEFMP